MLLHSSSLDDLMFDFPSALYLKADRFQEPAEPIYAGGEGPEDLQEAEEGGAEGGPGPGGEGALGGEVPEGGREEGRRPRQVPRRPPHPGHHHPPLRPPLHD